MPRRLFNWSYSDVTAFLSAHGFHFNKYIEGSHERWAILDSEGRPIRIVEVNRTKTSYKVKTLRTIIRQSGIPQHEWLKWTKS